MPRSLPYLNRWRALAALLAFTAFVSLMLAHAGAQGRGGQQNTASGTNQQQRRKSIVSVLNTDTTDGSRVSITSDAALNDYAAYWSGDTYYVVIPEADLVTRDVQGLQNSLRGQGFQNVRIERKGRDVVISFRLRPGMRARVEQKFNRLDVIFTAPPGVTFNPNGNRNTAGGGSTVGGGTSNTAGGNTSTGGGRDLNGGAGGGRTGTTAGTGRTGGTATASTGGGGGGGRGGRRVPRYPAYGSGGGGGGDRGGGAPLNIPLPSAMQPEATPTPVATPPSATTNASPTASPAVGNENAQANTSASPAASGSPTPEQIAQAQPPITSPPQTTSTTTTTAPGAPTSTSTNTGFAAAVRENWLPLLIGLLVLVAIGLLLASRSRSDRDEGREPERLQSKKVETIKDKPASSTAAKVAAGTAGAAAVAAMARESRAKTTTKPEEPVKTEDEKGIEAVAPTVAMERVSSEVKNLLEGKDYDEAIIASTNAETRQIVSTELLAALASRNPERRLRAREAFNKHGFFDEATQRLRTSTTPAERISAARSLGLTQDNAATPHLVVALEDDDPEVRRASVNALAELRDPAAIGPLNALLEREKNRKVPHSLIRRAIEASATIDVSGEDKPAVAEAQGTTATSAEKKDKDDDDREVFEI